jgi:hypothetical protein
MMEVFWVAQQVQSFCEVQGWKFCFLGGIALQRWGEPRVTQDIHVMLWTGFGNEETFIHPLIEQFKARIEDAESFALKSRVLLLQSEHNIGMDIALGALDFEALVVERASIYEFFPEITLRICSAEDLIIYKAFADRPRDWGDIEGVILRQQGRLDWDYISEQLTPLVLLKEQPDILEKLQKLKAKALST